VTLRGRSSAPGGGGTKYASYAYDPAGNQTTRCYGGDIATCPGEKQVFTYDGYDQLRKALKSTGVTPQGSEDYFYDHAGQRLAVVRRNAANATTGMTWFIGPVEANYNGAGALVDTTSHIAVGTPVASVNRTGPTTTTVDYRFNGLASNILAIVPALTASPTTSFSMTPHGRLLEVTGPASAATRRRLNDKYVDAGTELGYYGARYYDNVSLTWTQADPLYLRLPDIAMGAPRRASAFTFSLNNPVRYVDPDGLDPEAKSLDSYVSEFEATQRGRAYHLASTSDAWMARRLGPTLPAANWRFESERI
jgi:RHS repeat-associated protein